MTDKKEDKKEAGTEKKIVRVDMRDYRDIYYYDDGSVEEYRYND